MPVVLGISIESVGKVVGALVPVVLGALKLLEWWSNRKRSAAYQAVPVTAPMPIPPIDTAAITQRLVALERTTQMRNAWELDDALTALAQARAKVRELEQAQQELSIEEARTSAALSAERAARAQAAAERDQAIAELGRLKLSLVPKEDEEQKT